LIGDIVMNSEIEQVIQKSFLQELVHA